MTKEELFERIKKELIATFELDADKITPDAELVGDLDLDSIDAVDLIVKMKPYVEGAIEAAQFKDARTVQDVVDILFPLLKK
jgi:acyl carrier protein